MLNHRVISVGSFAVNCVLVSCGEDCVIVDPGQDAADILSEVRTGCFTVRAVFFTHCHFDHIGGLPGLLEAYPELPVYAHPSDWPMFGHPMNAFAPDYPLVGRPRNLRDIRTAPADLSAFGFEIIETPGHTPGSVCIKAGGVLFSGDTLFAGSCGRTDFPGGSMAAMRRSLSVLAALPPEISVVPGHGATTTIGREAESNPFIIR
jgi:glyoxylase-like metal-dependent hydrolase (beta-lactamase superfamily II)